MESIDDWESVYMTFGWRSSVSRSAANMGDASALSIFWDLCTVEVHCTGKEKIANEEVCWSELPSVATIEGCACAGGRGVLICKGVNLCGGCRCIGNTKSCVI